MNDKPIDFKSRVLCSDGTCIGVVGEDGRCKDCGKPYIGEETIYRKQNDNNFILSCLFCNKSLRIEFPFKSLKFRCSNCHSKYVIHTTNGNIGVYLVVPQLDRNSSDNPPKEPPITEAIKKALHLFALDKSASLVDLKVAYRKSMAEYHPDKVSHLGADLRRLAEEKTKGYNTAFDVAKKYFDQII